VGKGLTESITSSCIPRELMYSRNLLGTGNGLSPVPNSNISIPYQHYALPPYNQQVFERITHVHSDLMRD